MESPSQRRSNLGHTLPRCAASRRVRGPQLTLQCLQLHLVCCVLVGESLLQALLPRLGCVEGGTGCSELKQHRVTLSLRITELQLQRVALRLHLVTLRQ